MRARFYHAGLSSEDRINVQRSWASGLVQIIVATIAFGMGNMLSKIVSSAY